MAKKLPIVALVGQTNAGKSSLLNRLARKNIAIVAREEGTTRDNVVTRIDDGEGTPFILVDTAGLKEPTDDFEASIQDQIEDAIESAEVILVVLDATKYFDERDRRIAKGALKSGKPVILVLNKCDLKATLPVEEFRALGIAPEKIVYVSATTGAGIAKLKRKVEETLGRFVAEQDSHSRDVCDDGSTSARSPVTTGATSGPENDYPAPLDNIPKKTIRETPQAEAEFADDFSGTSPAALFRGSEASTVTKLALIGRPNVGKSSLFNALGRKQQAIVSARQGTTRDVNRVEVRYKRQDLEILDTAGLRRQGKREVGIEKFSALRTLAAIEEADVCALLVDATEPHAKLDQTLAGAIVKAGKGIIVVVTKADLVENGTDEILDGLERDFDFLPFAPVVVTSSETGENVTQLFELAVEIAAARRTEIKTSELNKILAEAVAAHPPAGLKNTRPKPKYMVQTDVCPPWFVVQGRDLGLLHWSWKRFLERKLREKYPLVGVPIMISYRNDQEQSRRGA